MIGQFCRDVIGCKTQVAFVSCDWSIFHPSVELGVLFGSLVSYVKVVNKAVVLSK